MNNKRENIYAYSPPIETLRHFKNTSAEDRLNWLEEARQFVIDFVPPEKLEKWRKITNKT
jgi:hypothetical protein